ncbi:MAG: hypothetical protein EXR77_15560 [Myxococcales bacterium]|nr:hypothetical protein [Myxococcales bacterium]
MRFDNNINWPSCKSFAVAVLSLGIGAVGCGEVRLDASVAPADVGSDVGQDTALGLSDSAAPADAGSNVGQDTAGGPSDSAVDVASGCSKDLECDNIKGKTPCNLPSCDVSTGKCVLKPREVGEACNNPLDEAGECEKASCDKDGACVKAAKAEGGKCGANVCGKKCASGKCVSTSEKDYDDGLACTKDYCDQGNEIKHDPLTGVEFPCSDNDKCTEDAICVGGQCKGQPITCTDGVLCTVDSCDKVKGCVFLPDNKKCTGTEPCLNIACDLTADCTATTPKLGACNDGNACTTNDLCDKGLCKGKPDLAKCGCSSDADCAKNNTLCGGKFKCVVSTKVCELDAVTVVSCPPVNDGCSTNACDAATGTCVAKDANDGKECDDNNLCTSDTKCAGGSCKGGPTSCDDKNPCTADSCTPGAGCNHEAMAAPCDDSNKCTTDDVCTLAGICAGAKKACDDNLACTYDGCESTSGNCSNAPQDKLCDDKNPCTADKCAPVGGCQNKANDASPCDDGSTCTTDSCVSGACKSVNTCQCTGAGDCDDKNACTADACNAGKCAYTNAPSTQSCDSSNKCMEVKSGLCGNGVCTGGKPKTCAADMCTSATCNPTTGQCGTVPKADGTLCDADNNGCTTKDTCKSGQCSWGVQATCILTDCDDVTCISTSPTTFECKSAPFAKGKACDDSLFCTVADACDGAGKCGGKTMVCEQAGNPTGLGSNPCATQVCNETIKACEVKGLPPSTACDDGKFCTVGDKCDVKGQCIGGQPPKCAGGTGCQVGFCDEAADKCGLTLKPNCCATSADCNDGYSCTTDSCSAPPSGMCNFVPMLKCCDQLAYFNDFDDGTPKGLMFNNSAGPSQGWQLVPLPGPCPPNGPGCDKGAQSGKTVLYFGDATTWSFNFGPEPSSGTVRLPVKTVPFQKGWAALKFSLYMGTEAGNGYDQLKVYLQPLPATSTEPMPEPLPPIWTKPQDLTINEWHYIPIANLAESLYKMAAGTKYQVVIEFNTVDGKVNNGLGVLIPSLVYQTEFCQ